MTYSQTPDGIGSLDEVRAAISQVDMKTIINGVNDEVNYFVEECNRRYMEEEVNKHYGTFSHSIERQLVKDAVGEELAKYFPKGLNDLLSTKAGADPKVVDAVGIVKGAIAKYLSEAIKICRDKELAPDLVVKQYQVFAGACVEAVEKNKVWLSGVIFKEGLSVALGNAAKEMQASENAQEIK